MMVNALIAFGVGRSWPTWTYLPLVLWLVLTAVVYGVSIRLGTRRERT